MNTCSYCKHLYGAHSQACPEAVKDEELKRTRVALYKLGWRAGRSWGTEPSQLNADHCVGMNFAKHPTFDMGVNEGNIALEEAENGYDPRLDG